MVDISANPIRLLKMAFGKHAGMPFTELPWDYLDWILHKSKMPNEPEHADVVHTARLELKRRADSPDEPRPAAKTTQREIFDQDPDAWRREMERF
ncbi:hypothetical protein ACVOMV_24840 [Mesorhizobium atlanticum]